MTISKKAKDLIESIKVEHNITSAAGLELLNIIAEAFTTIEVANRQMTRDSKADDVLFGFQRNRFDKSTTHPGMVNKKQAEDAIRQTIKLLAIELESEAAPGEKKGLSFLMGKPTHVSRHKAG